MADSEEKDRILQAFVDEFKCYPQKPQELMAFTKRSEDLNNLKYTEATKIIHYSKKKTKNGINTSRPRTKSKYKISPKIRPSRPRAASKYKILPKKERKPNKRSQSDTKNTKNMDYKIGDHVILTQDREGIIRYVGNVEFTSGIMFGIELKEGALGKHDGEVHNKRYFTAPKQRGIFVKPSRIRRKSRQRDRKSSFKLNRSAAIEQLKKRESTEKKRWRAPYEVYETNNIERTSMRIMYTKASSNLHTHILQKVNEAKIRNDIRNSATNILYSLLCLSSTCSIVHKKIKIYY